MRPLADRVVIERAVKEETSKGGIVLPDRAQKDLFRGKIVEVGPGARNESGDVIPMALEVGDDVLYTMYAGTEVEYNGVQVLIMRESDVLAVI